MQTNSVLALKTVRGRILLVLMKKSALQRLYFYVLLLH